MISYKKMPISTKIGKNFQIRPAGRYLFLFLCLSFFTGYAQSPDQNYVRTRVPLVALGTESELNSASADKDSVSTTIQYFDGLGRPLQTVQRQASPSGRDIVQPVEYDAFGREVKKYLPYADQAASGYGDYKPAALSDQGAFYADPVSKNAPKVAGTPLGTAFSETVFEASPLNRVLEQGAPGTSWQVQAGSTGHTTKVGYTTNDATAFNPANALGSRRVVLFGVTVNVDGSRTLTRATNAVYADNELYVTISKDENWTAADGCVGTTEEYKDKEGHVVLKRTYNRKNNATEMLSTYYVYDDFGSLCFVLPPGANPDNGLPATSTISKLCYSYRYDGRQRLVEKTIPGNGSTYYVYNELDQLVAEQDQVLITNNSGRWLYYKYDVFGREIIQGWHDIGSIIGRDSMQAIIDGQAVLWEGREGKDLGYDNLAWPQNSVNFYYVDYYDGYELYNLPATPGYAYQAYGVNVTSGPARGLKTARLIRPSANSINLWTVYYYDDQGRPIQEQSNNHLRPNDRNTENYVYDFTGNVIKKERFHTGPLGQTITIVNTYTYDHQGRKVRTEQKTGAGPQIVLSHNTYNELGQLTDKKLHSKNNGTDYLQSVDYRYNIRGWLTSVNDPGLAANNTLNEDDGNSDGDKFGMALTYDNGAIPEYNGNISAVSWQSVNPYGTPVQLKYDYGYDKLNRLTASESSTFASGSWTKDRNYSEYLDYDVMGNIQKLGRWAPVSGIRRQIDSLVYTYNGSRQHNRIDDMSPEAAAIKDLGFKDGTPPGDEYSYRPTGQVSKDLNKGISSISYSTTGTISKATFLNGTTIDYVNARGTYELLSTNINRGGGVTELRDRIRGINYLRNNGGAWALDFIQTEEGRIRRSGSDYVYEYDLKDHLGNTRATIKADPADTSEATAQVLQVNSYYGFGMEMPGPDINYETSPKNHYLYNGKEQVPDLGWYDYGARMYDPAIARWNAVDPLAEVFEDLSPYNYAMNNPILMIDPDGMAADTTVNGGVLQEVKVVAVKVARVAGAILLRTGARVGAGWLIEGADPEPVTKIIGAVVMTAVTIGVLGHEIYKFAKQDDTNKTHSVNAEKTVEDFEAESEPIKVKNQKKNKFYKGNGEMDQADKDFDALGPNVTGRIPEKKGRMGTLPDGRKINVRNGSSTPGDDPTIQITNPDGSTIKWRYEK